jgi:hypothetical protein
LPSRAQSCESSRRRVACPAASASSGFAILPTEWSRQFEAFGLNPE